MREALESELGEPAEARLDWRPQTTVDIDENVAESLFKMLDVLDDNDDVQRVAANFDAPDDVIDRLSS